MLDIDKLEAKWTVQVSSRPLKHRPEITEEGLVLGAGTMLASVARDATGIFKLVLDGEEERIVALLSIACGQNLPASVITGLRKASDCWSRDDKCLAHVHLSQAGLPAFDDLEHAFRLFAVNELLEAGFSPRMLMRALGLDPAPLEDLKKYNSDQPRVPAGNGRESGQWTYAGGGREPSRVQFVQAGDSRPPLRLLHPDSTYETDSKAKRSLEYWRQRPTEEIIQSLEPQRNTKEPLTVKPDGTIMQGNTRVKVLQGRGVDVNALPRARLDGSIEIFLPRLRTPGGGGGSGRDKKYPLQE
jgi:hypothetical protein